jgi:hypothetical protein
MAGDFHGLLTLTLENAPLRLECLATAGPRIVRLFVAGTKENVLVEIPDITLPTPLGAYSLRGGHRLWHGPEGMPRSYVPDDSGLEVHQVEGGVALIQAADSLTGIRKRIDVRLDSDAPRLVLRHELRNDGAWPVELAPWAITQLPLGGVAVLPQQESPLESDPHGLLPNRQLVIWPYARWSDPRLSLTDGPFAYLSAQPLLPPCKIGYLNRAGWVAYFRNGVLFRKRFAPQLDKRHVDFGCNVEVYCNDRFVEVETLGPLSRLEPGRSVEHVETWEVTAGLDLPNTIDGARQAVTIA